jgi:endonuclease/exonuclease/phosphatase family metal-dependent hydrolase
MAKPSRPSIPNDRISELLGDRLPKGFADSDRFLDIISWNLRWFNSKNKERAKKIYDVLAALNADVFVFQEIEKDSLNDICDQLNDAGLGSYRLHYGTTGRDQRLAFMYDFDWVRAKDDIQELFGKKAVVTPSGKDVFPRLPLWSYFYTRSVGAAFRGFDFQIVGLHLKSQLDRAGTGEDKLQRRLSSDKLADWLIKEASVLDSDVILIGDWNETPAAEEWQAFHRLEKKKIVAFQAVNDESEFSHLYYKNINNLGSRLDLAVVSSDGVKQMKSKPKPILWLTLEELLSGSASAGEVKKVITEIKKEVTDHLPLHNRFYQSLK